MRRPLLFPLLGIVLVAIASLVFVRVNDWAPELGLDLQGGVSVVLAPSEPVAEDTIEQSVEIIRNRVDALGVAEPDISRQGDAIVVQLPGVKDQQRAIDIVGDTAELRFRPVLELLPPPGATTTTASTTTTTTAPTPSTTAVAPGETTTTTSTTSTTVPGTTSREEDKPAAEVVLPELDESGEPVALFRLGPTRLTGNALADAQASFDANTGAWAVDFTMTDQGAPQFDTLASELVATPAPGNQLGIVLDGVVVSAPTIQTGKFGGKGQISGDFTEEEAKDLALVLRFGALPVELVRQSTQTVSATLGRDSLNAGVAAGAIGLLLVLLYIIAYYRALGLVVVVGLGVTGALMWSLVALLGETAGLALTLAGATGLIVSIGVTVDSYIVYFERLKDEVRSGKTIRSSVDRGFGRAFRTTVAANMSSLIGAALLYWLAVGPVRGFALMLFLSQVLDLVVCYFFTRPAVILLGRSRLFTEARWLGVARGLAAQPERGT
ncbi:MAG TPA: protein translocase subunit SecD [Acidimicrobiales bacterium]|nr:protein translocase subunit SecD [Acidimicrobiales bacterium]